MMATVLDETYGPDGTLVSSRQRTITQAPPTEAQYRAARRAVRAILDDATANATAKALARFLLMVGYREYDEDVPDITPG